MGILGYQNYQRRPQGSPDPQMVGELLAQQSQNPMASGVSRETPQPETPTMDPLPAEPDPDALAQQTDWPSSAAAALRAAIPRGPRKPVQDPAPMNPANRAQLLRFGIPEGEIDLLEETGGSN